MKKKIIDPVHQRVVDFFYVYYDEKTSRNVARHPEIALPMLKETIKKGLNSSGALRAYAAAISDAAAIQYLGTPTENKTLLRSSSHPETVEAK